MSARSSLSVLPSRTGRTRSAPGSRSVSGSKYTVSKSGGRSGYTRPSYSKSGYSRSAYQSRAPSQSNYGASGYTQSRAPSQSGYTRSAMTSQWNPASRTPGYSGYPQHSVLTVGEPAHPANHQEEKKSKACCIVSIIICVVVVCVGIYAIWYFGIRDTKDTTGQQVDNRQTQHQGGQTSVKVGERPPTGPFTWQYNDGTTTAPKWKSYNRKHPSWQKIEDAFQKYFTSSQEKQVVEITPAKGYRYLVEIISPTDIKQHATTQSGKRDPNGRVRTVRRQLGKEKITIQMGQTGTWQYYENGKWKYYSDICNATINEKSQAGKTRFNLAVLKYTGTKRIDYGQAWRGTPTAAHHKNFVIVTIDFESKKQSAMTRNKSGAYNVCAMRCH